MSKIQLISDLHRDLNPKVQIQVSDADVLVIAGDIVTGGRGFDIENNCGFLHHTWKEHQKPIIFVLGNHEFYGHQFNEVVEEYRRHLDPGRVRHRADIVGDIHFLHNETVKLGDTHFVGSTLWSDQSFNSPSIRGRGMLADYDNIFNGVRADGYRNYLTDDVTIDAHRRAIIFLRSEAERLAGEKICVVTHHCPSSKSINMRYINDSRNGYFSSPVIENNPWCDHVGLWLHGHTHCSFDYMAGSTRVVCNPYGYGVENIREFNPSLVLEY